MIRSAAFSLLTLALVVTGFYIYWQYQPKLTSFARPAATNPSPLMPDETHLKIGPGRRAWAQSFDERGRLTSSFRADEFSPQKDRSFKVLHPESIFYLEDGQYMYVTGETGDVFAEGSGTGASPSDASPIHPPSNGVLQNVRIKLYPNHDAAEPTLVIEMNNARFDNDTLRLYTQGYQTANGQDIPADMVPVTVRGDDYDFDGTGLTLRWDDRDHRLQLLEIAHGKRFTIKNPSKLSMPGAAPAEPHSQRTNIPAPVALVDASLDAAALAMPPAELPKRATPYRAIFHDNVKIDQGNRQVASADLMTVDFLQKASKTGPTTAAAAAPPVTEPSIPPAAQQVAQSTVSSVAPAAKQKAPSSQPNQPVTIFWTGKLRITPLDSAPLLPIPAGQAVVQLLGSPVVLTPQGSTIIAANVIYRSGDSAGMLANSATIPHIELNRDDNKLHFVATSLTYDPGTAQSIVAGPSTLRMVTEDGQNLNASWTGRGVFHVIPKAGQPDTVDHGDLYDNVIVTNPKFNLTSNQLALDMEKSVSQGTTKEGVTLKRATAIGNAICKLTEEKGGNREIDGDRVVIETVRGPDGKPIPRSLSADGSVKAFDPDQKLTAGHLEALLRSKPKSTTQKSADPDAMELESMDARDNVSAVLKNGTIAQADQLHVRDQDGHQQVALVGQPATVDDGKGGILTGPSIFIVPDESSLSVQGAGHMSRLRKATTRPTVISWAKSLQLDGPANTVDVLGNVEANAVDTNGTTNDMTADTAHADLVDAPHNKKAQPSSDDDDFAGKALKVLTLVGNVHGTSLLKAADGSTLRHGDIKGPKLIYTAESGRMEMPGAGSLLVENHKPAGEPVKADPNSLGSNFGNLAMRWEKSLVYDPPAQTVVFDGDCVTWFQQDAKDAGLMKLEHANTITAFLEPVPTTAPATTQPSQAKMQLSHVVANGAVSFHAKAFELSDADRVDYDPKTNLLKAHGTDAQPAHVRQEDGTMNSFDEVIFNVKTQMLESSKGAKGDLRR